MDRKLTLSFNDEIIESAKRYARSNNTSLSKLVETYLRTLVKREKEEIEISPLVKSLSGVITLDEDFDIEDAYSQYLLEKYK